MQNDYVGTAPGISLNAYWNSCSMPRNMHEQTVRYIIICLWNKGPRSNGSYCTHVLGSFSDLPGEKRKKIRRSPPTVSSGRTLMKFRLSWTSHLGLEVILVLYITYSLHGQENNSVSHKMVLARSYNSCMELQHSRNNIADACSSHHLQRQYCIATFQI